MKFFAFLCEVSEFYCTQLHAVWSKCKSLGTCTIWFCSSVWLYTITMNLEQKKILGKIEPQHSYSKATGRFFPSSVADHSGKNLMAASNLGVVFGPTLMKSKEETMAAIMNLKYQSIVIELLINEFDTVSISVVFSLKCHLSPSLNLKSMFGQRGWGKWHLVYLPLSS